MILDNVIHKEESGTAVSQGYLPIGNSGSYATLVSIARNEKPKNIVLAVPGYPGDAISGFHGMARKLVGDGTTTIALGYPGVHPDVLSNGLGVEVQATPDKFDFYNCPEAVKFAVEYIKLHSDAKIIVAGHSFGGWAVAKALEDRMAPDIHHVFLLSPMVNVGLLEHEFPGGPEAFKRFIEEAIEGNKIMANPASLMNQLSYLTELPYTRSHRIPVTILNATKDVYDNNDHQIGVAKKKLIDAGHRPQVVDIETDHSFEDRPARKKLLQIVRKVTQK